MGAWTDIAFQPLPDWYWFWSTIDGLSLRHVAREYWSSWIVGQWGWWLMLWTTLAKIQFLFTLP